MRICSLLPSATEIVFALGRGDQLVAVTHECDYPPEVAGLPVVTRNAIDHAAGSMQDIHNHIASSVHGGSSVYYVDHQLLRELEPDLILTQELCKVCAVSYGEVQRAVRQMEGAPMVVSLEPRGLDQILDTVVEVARLSGVPEAGSRLARESRARIDSVVSMARGVASRPRVLALEWLDPPFVGGHWVPEMIRLGGGVDGLGREGRPSYETSWPAIAEYDPEVIVVMACGFDLESTIQHLGRTSLPDSWAGLSGVRQGRVYAVNGSAYFSRPGPRALDGLEVLAEIIHPDLFARSKADDVWRWLDATGA